MNQPLFIQIHTLTSYPGTLLNRDDAGFAKRLPFGGATRTRISSQCLKRHWRRFDGEFSLATLQHKGEPTQMAVRSRQTFDRFIFQPLKEAGVAPELARQVTEALMTELLGESAKAKKKKQESEESGDAPSVLTNQITVLGRPELAYLLQEGKALAAALEKPFQDAADLEEKKRVRAQSEALKNATKERFTKDWVKNLRGLKMAAGLDAALFGRMVTSDKLSRADAAIHVAHALTVHAEQSESDYFSAMDDLLAEAGDEPGELGSGHINSVELTSGLFYGYVVVDVAQLVSNIEGVASADWRRAPRQLAADVVGSLIQLMCRVSPGAKLGSTAPYANAHLALVEVGKSQPRTLANAFLKPVSMRDPGSMRGDLLSNAYAALTTYINDVDAMYELDLERRLAATGVTDQLKQLATPTTLKELSRFASNAIVEA